MTAELLPQTAGMEFGNDVDVLSGINAGDSYSAKQGQAPE